MGNNRRVGSEYEERAALYLEGMGYRILERNFRCRLGEIDLVARHKGYLVFVEVKYRRSERYGAPAEAVGYQKQRTISKVAQYYLMRRGLGSRMPVRFDVVSVLGEDIEVYENAFEFCV